MDRKEVEYLTGLRRFLHQSAEPAGREERTAARLVEELEQLYPDTLVEGLGGNGLAAVFEGPEAGRTLLIRADMDALPITETVSLDRISETSGVAHKCGHDGHMAMAVGVARRFASARPARGRLVVLFQPSEETGEGARAVIEDPAFAPLRPDAAIAAHNLPGFDLGRVVIRAGLFACASRGLVVEMTGATSHAAEPQRGRSPALAVAQVIESWSAARQLHTGLDESVQATVIHATVGHPTFGTSPGEGRVMATLRAGAAEPMERLASELRFVAERIAEAHRLDASFSEAEPFPATTNDPRTVEVVLEAADALGFGLIEPAVPFGWSEDFGHFGRICAAALIGLGAGKGLPPLHHPTYGFPDPLIPHGVALLEATARRWFERHG